MTAGSHAEFASVICPVSLSGERPGGSLQRRGQTGVFNAQDMLAADAAPSYFDLLNAGLPQMLRSLMRSAVAPYVHRLCP